MPRRRRQTVLAHYVAHFGVHKGGYRAAHFVQMAMVAVEHGEDWSASQYAAYWGVDERTCYAHRAEAREVFGDRWREVVWELAQKVTAEGVRSPGQALKLVLA